MEYNKMPITVLVQFWSVNISPSLFWEWACDWTCNWRATQATDPVFPMSPITVRMALCLFVVTCLVHFHLKSPTKEPFFGRSYSVTVVVGSAGNRQLWWFLSRVPNAGASPSPYPTPPPYPIPGPPSPAHAHACCVENQLSISLTSTSASSSSIWTG